MFALLSNIVSAQFCGTPDSIVDNLWSPTGNTIAQGSLDGACINVYFHIVRNTNQTGSASISQTNDNIYWSSFMFQVAASPPPGDFIISPIGGN